MRTPTARILPVGYAIMNAYYVQFMINMLLSVFPLLKNLFNSMESNMHVVK